MEIPSMNKSPNIAQNELSKQAKAIPFEVRKKILMTFQETEIHSYLKTMFERMEPNYIIEVTHGAGELGKDLVIVKKDRLTTDVIAVIVKCGNIRAQTAGDVDEINDRVTKVVKSSRVLRDIESQVDQALVHPAEIKSKFEKLPVTRVFVVLVGEISGHVRKRVQAEIEKKGSIDIFDIDWLVVNFTEYYPQLFFEGKVIDFFQRKIEQLEVGYCMSGGKNLSEYFVEPVVAAADITISFDGETVPLAIDMKKMPFAMLKNIIAGNKKIILVGDAGVGKSGALAKMAIDLLIKAYEQSTTIDKHRKIEIPVLIRATEFLAVNSIDDIFAYFYDDYPVIDDLVVKLLMVDGLDEIAVSERSSVIEKARLYSEELSCSLIITGRKIDIFDNLPSAFKKYELLPFEFGQAIKLFKKLVKNKKQLDILKQGLDKIKHQIPMVPLSLMLLIELVEKNKEIPASVTELYDRFLDLVLGRWDKSKGIEVLFDYFVKKKFLASLAYKEFLQKRRLEISIEEFEKFCEEYVADYGGDISVFLKEIERSGIIDSNATVNFCHKSFLDYFAAYHIYEERAEFQDLNDFIVKLYFDDLFGEVAFFYIGLIREISEAVLNKIFEHQDDGLMARMQKFVSGVLLQAGWHTPTKLKRRGIERAISLAPSIRQQFLDMVEEKTHRMPRILGDFFLVTLSDFSFGSGFLYEEVKSLFDELSKNDSLDSAYKMLILLWSVQRFLGASERRAAIGEILGSMSRIASQLSAEDQARLLIFLKIMDDQKQDKVIRKVIDKKLSKMKKSFPNIFKKLLPSKKDSYIK